jgi:hypothetical protein
LGLKRMPVHGLASCHVTVLQFTTGHFLLGEASQS